jgi:hypothetical protein
MGAKELSREERILLTRTYKDEYRDPRVRIDLPVTAHNGLSFPGPSGRRHGGVDAMAVLRLEVCAADMQIATPLRFVLRGQAAPQTCLSLLLNAMVKSNCALYLQAGVRGVVRLPACLRKCLALACALHTHTTDRMVTLALASRSSTAASVVVGSVTA